MTTNALITAENLCRSFNHQPVVQKVSFQLNEGEVLGLLGPNGAGKTTTMKMLSGVLAPSMGSIKIAGYDITKSAKKAKSNIGYLPETPPLYLQQTVEDYLKFVGKIRQIKKAQISMAIKNVIKKCSLEDVKKRRIGNLSTGYKQRIGIAQAIIHQPKVIILDEPTNGLDPTQIVEIRELIRKLAKNHGIIFSSHILSEVESICNKILIIHQGQTLVNDSLANLKNELTPDRLTAYFDNPPESAMLLAIDGVASVQPITHGYTLKTDNPKQMANHYSASAR